MTIQSWNDPWKLTAVGMALVIATGIVTGLVVANWGGREGLKKAVDVSQAGQRENTKDTVIAGAVGAVAGAAVGAAGGAVVAGGSGAGKGAIIGGLVGAGGGTLYGLNENKKTTRANRKAYAACMHSRGYSG
jgi:hypothetical protein